MYDQIWHWRGRKVPMNSLLDLFLFISRDIKAGYTKSRNLYGLSSGTLAVQLDVTIDKADIHEVIEIEKEWDPSVRERIRYSMDYVEPHIYEAHERERMKAAPDGDWCYRAHLKTENRNRYLSNEMFLDNIHIHSTRQCRFEYQTTRLDRGLRSLANLEIPTRPPDPSDAMEAFPALYAEMLKRGEWLLAGQLGEDRAKWKGTLLRGKADLPLPFKITIDGICPVWVVGRGLVTLCRVYGRPTIH